MLDCLLRRRVCPESGRPPRLGWVIFDPKGTLMAAATCLLLAAIPALWKARVQQIFPAEALAPSVALANHASILQGTDIRWFIDNESACSTLIRGASREEDVQSIAECTQLLAMRLDIRIWFEWVDTKANPSDGLSREGLDCPLFGTRAITADQPAWQLIENDTDRLRTIATAHLGDLCQP